MLPMRTSSLVRKGRARLSLSCFLLLAAVSMSKAAHAEKVLVKFGRAQGSTVSLKVG